MTDTLASQLDAKDAITVCNDLMTIGRLPYHKPDIQASTENPSLWRCIVAFDYTLDNNPDIPLQVSGEATTKQVAKRLAYEEAFKAMGWGSKLHTCVYSTIHYRESSTLTITVARGKSTPVSSIGIASHKAHVALQAEKKNRAREKTKEPTKGQRRRIEIAKVHLINLGVMMSEEAPYNTGHTLVLDVERHECPPHELLEVGLVQIKFGDLTVVAEHFVVDEHRHIQNVHCLSRPNDFSYGRTKIAPLAEIVQQLKRTVELAEDSGAGWVVGHSLEDHDLPWLQAIGITFEELRIVDINEVEKAARDSHDATGLDVLINPNVYNFGRAGAWHNAGNDAVATAWVMLEQARRWKGANAARVDELQNRIHSLDQTE